MALAFLCHSFCIGTHLGFEQFFGTTGPGTLAENLLDIFCKNHFALHQKLGQLGVSVLVLCEYLLGALVLLVDHLQHFVVHDFGRSLRVGALEAIFAVVIVAHVGQFLAHAGIGYHAVSLLRGALQVVHGTCRDVADEQFLGGTTA